MLYDGQALILFGKKGLEIEGLLREYAAHAFLAHCCILPLNASFMLQLEHALVVRWFVCQ